MTGMAELQPSVAMWLRSFLTGMAVLQPSVAVWLRPFLFFPFFVVVVTTHLDCDGPITALCSSVVTTLPDWDGLVTALCSSVVTTLPDWDDLVTALCSSVVTTLPDLRHDSRQSLPPASRPPSRPLPTAAIVFTDTPQPWCW